MRKFILSSLLLSLPLMAVVPIPKEKSHHNHITTPTDVKMGLLEVVFTAGGAGAALIVGTPLVPAIAVGVGFATICSIFSGNKNNTSNDAKNSKGKWVNPNCVPLPKNEPVAQPLPQPTAAEIQAQKEAQLKASKAHHEAQMKAQREAQMKAERERTEKASAEWAQKAWEWGRSRDSLSETLSTPPHNNYNEPPHHEKIHWEPPHYEKHKQCPIDPDARWWKE